MKKQFEPAADAIGFLLGDLQVVVRKPERAEINHAEKGQPNEAVVRPRPENTREHDRADDENAAHRGHALFGAMQFGQPMHFVRRPDRLTDLERNQFPDDEIAEGQAKARKP